MIIWSIRAWAEFKALLRAQEFEKLHAHFLVVQVALEIDQVSFYARGASGGSKVGRTPTLVTDGIRFGCSLFAVDPGPGGVHAKGGGNLSGPIGDIGGGEPQPAPAPVTVRNRSLQRVWTSQQLGRLGDLTLAHQFADAAGRNALARCR